MADKRQIGVRYCGGCNPRYDRVALVKRLEKLLPGVSFVPAMPAVPYPAALVVCGCPSRCARVDDLAVPTGRMIWMGGWDDLLPTKKRIAELETEELSGPRSLSHEQVLGILPHREPMLFVDTVTGLIPGVEATASFYVRPDLPAFSGHFPGEPLFPGVYTVEAAAQTADIVLMTLDRYAGRLPLFTGIRKAGFRRKICPGDTLRIFASVLEERPELGWAVCRGQVFRGDELAADMELQLAMRESEHTVSSEITEERM